MEERQTMLIEFEGVRPTVAESAWIAPTATLIGDVVVGEGASIWYGAVLRADHTRIEIGEEANIQDNSVLHASPGRPIIVGARVTVGHMCMIHGCVLGEQSLVGNGATVLDGAQIGRRSLVAAHALVREGFVLEDEMIAGGVPAAVIGSATKPGVRDLILSNGEEYRRLAGRHRDTCREVPRS